MAALEAPRAIMEPRCWYLTQKEREGGKGKVWLRERNRLVETGSRNGQRQVRRDGMGGWRSGRRAGRSWCKERVQFWQVRCSLDLVRLVSEQCGNPGDPQIHVVAFPHAPSVRKTSLTPERHEGAPHHGRPQVPCHVVSLLGRHLIARSPDHQTRVSDQDQEHERHAMK